MKKIINLFFKKYYWVLYKCTHYGWNEGGRSTGITKVTNSEIIDIHPIQWQINLNEKYGHQHDSEIYGYSCKEEYLIINWKQISKREFKKFKGYVG